MNSDGGSSDSFAFHERVSDRCCHFASETRTASFGARVSYREASAHIAFSPSWPLKSLQRSYATIVCTIHFLPLGISSSCTNPLSAHPCIERDGCNSPQSPPPVFVCREFLFF